MSVHLTNQKTFDLQDATILALCLQFTTFILFELPAKLMLSCDWKDPKQGCSKLISGVGTHARLEVLSLNCKRDLQSTGAICDNTNGSIAH